MKVLHIIPDNGLGGVQEAAKSIRAVKKKDTIKVLFLNENNIQYIFCEMKNADVLVFSLWKSVWYLIAQKFINIFFHRKQKIVFFLHSTNNAHIFDFIFTNIGIALSSHIFVDSAATLLQRSKLAMRKRFQIISMKLDFNFFDLYIARSYEALHFVYWGRIHPVKNIEKSIDFVREAFEKCPQTVTFTIYGSGDETYIQKLKTKNADLIDTGVLAFKGFIARETIPKQLQRMNFFLSTSEYEGFSMAVLEAMSIGLIPVIHPVGESSNYCEDKKNAILIGNFINFITKVDSNTLRRISIEAIKKSNEYEDYSTSFNRGLSTIFNYK